jgi:hypothetical protein
MRKAKRITARKYQGDDEYSWAVFFDGRPVYTGLNRSVVAYYKKLVAKINNLPEGV